MAETEPKKSLSLAQKFKVGLKSFVVSAISYIPRGAALIGVMFAGSALLGHMTGGLDPLGVTNAYNGGTLAAKFGLTLLLGGAITGGFGAWQDVDSACKKCEAQLAAQGEELKRHREAGRDRSQKADYDMPSPQSDLPMGKPGNKQLTGYIG